MGQDSVVNAVYQGKIHWFWGDTNRPDYPLGNFHVPGATSELPGRGGLDPSKGVDLRYFLDEKGFAKPTAPMPGDGPTWISGLIVLRDRDGKERMFANYVKIRNMLEVYQQGLAEFHPESQRFEKVVQFPDAAAYRRRLSQRARLPAQGPGRRLCLLRQPLSLDPRAGGPRSDRQSGGIRVVHLPEAGHEPRPAAARPRAGGRPPLRLEAEYAGPAPGGAEPSDRRRTHPTHRGAPEPAQRRHRQDGAGPRGLGLLE